MQRDGALTSVWQKEIGNFIPVNTWNKSEVYDALIVGGGITGLTTALLLQEQGKKCIVAEAFNIGFGTTGGTTAHLNTLLDTPYYQIEKDFGDDSAKLVANSTKEAIALIESISKEYQVDCDFQYTRGHLFALNDKQADELDKIVESSTRAGVKINYTEEIPVPIPFTKAAKFEAQAQFNIGKYLVGLAQAFEKAGGVILQNCKVEDHTRKEHFHAQTPFGEIEARTIVYATHIPPGINLLHFRCAPYRSYAAAFTLKDGNYPTGLSYDMEEPYHYFRTQTIDNKRYIIVGGFDHKTGHNDNTAETLRELEAYIRTYFDVDSIDYIWSSQYYTAADGLPYIGLLPGHTDVYTGTGYIGNGMIFGTLAGKIISDLIAGKENPYADLYKPSRIKPIAGFAEFVKENADVISRFIGDRFSYEQINALAELAPGEATVAEWENRKVAIYKDDNGKIYALNPVCPHAACIVNWNTAEKTWDCPCHGGRYAPNGTLLTGPATHGLASLLEQPIDGD